MHKELCKKKKKFTATLYVQKTEGGGNLKLSTIVNAVINNK